MRKFFSSPTAIVGTALLTIVLFAALFGPLIAPYDPQDSILSHACRDRLPPTGSAPTSSAAIFFRAS